MSVFCIQGMLLLSILMAFTMLDVKILVVVIVIQERALPNEFCSQMFLIYFVCCIFDSNSSWILLSTAQVCKYLVFCWHPKLMPMQISKLLALATVNTNVYKSVQKCYIISFSIHNYINVITI